MLRCVLASSLFSAALLVGCYNPGVAPCLYQCASGGACPDNLVCNGEGFCAAEVAASCKDAQSPNDGDLPPPDPKQIRVRVIDEERRGDPTAQVLFVDPSGGLVAVMTVDSNGVAAHDMPNGGSATAIRKETSAGNVAYGVTTFLDLWPGADIVSQPTPEMGAHSIDVTWQSGTVMANGPYAVLASGTHGANASAGLLKGSVMVSDGPLPADVLLLDAADKFYAVKKAVDVSSTGTSVDFGDSWLPTINFAGTLSHRPTVTTTVDYRFSPTPTLPSTGPKTGMQLFSDLITPSLPSVETSFVFTTNNPMSTANDTAVVFSQRVAAGTMSASFDFQDRALPWISGPVFSSSARSVQWTQTAEPGLSTQTAGLVDVEISYGRSAALAVQWRVIASASRVSMVSGTPTFQLPDIPNDPGENDREFEPREGDAFVKGMVRLMDTDAAQMRPFVSRFETRIQDHDWGADTDFTMAAVSSSGLFTATN